MYRLNNVCGDLLAFVKGLYIALLAKIIAESGLLRQEMLTNTARALYPIVLSFPPATVGHSRRIERMCCQWS